MDWSSFVEHLHSPLAVVMLVVFCLIVAWAYAPHRRARLDDDARIPLRDDR